MSNIQYQSQPQISNLLHKLLRLPAVCAMTGVGKTGVYQGIKERTFPAPIKIGGRAVAWIESEVSDWIESRIVATRGAGVQ